MKNKIISRIMTIFFLYFICICTHANANNNDIQANEASILIQVDTLLRSIDNLTQEIWPNYHPSQAPMLIAFKNSNVYAYNYNPKTVNNHPLTDQQLSVFQRVEHDYWHITEPGVIFKFIPDDGKLLYAFQFDGSTNEIDTITLLIFIHEYFHLFQFAHFNIPAQPLYKDHLNVENLLLSQIEEMLLLDYSTSFNQDTLRDYLAIYHKRKRLISSQSLQLEGNKLILEGGAHYVSARVLALNGIMNFSEFVKQEMKQNFQSGLVERSSHGRHYSVGATLMLALNHLKEEGYSCFKSWENQTQENKIAPNELLLSGLKLTQAEIDERYTILMNSIDTSSLRYQAIQDITTYKNTLQGIEQKFDQHPGTKINLQFNDKKVTGNGMEQSLATDLLKEISYTSPLTGYEIVDIMNHNPYVHIFQSTIMKRSLISPNFSFHQDISQLTIDSTPYKLSAANCSLPAKFNTLELRGTDLSITFAESGALKTEKDKLANCALTISIH